MRDGTHKDGNGYKLARKIATSKLVCYYQEIDSRGLIIRTVRMEVPGVIIPEAKALDKFHKFIREVNNVG